MCRQPRVVPDSPLSLGLYVVYLMLPISGRMEYMCFPLVPSGRNRETRITDLLPGLFQSSRAQA